jgi:IclR family acetate operon transcriptional repressor
MLAFLPENEVRAILEQYPLVKKTPRTITQKKHLLVHLASVRERAVALDLEENLTGVICVAAPIFDKTGRVIAGISLSGPASRMEPKLTEVQEEIRSSAKTLSRMLSPMPLAENGTSPYAHSNAR